MHHNFYSTLGQSKVTLFHKLQEFEQFPRPSPSALYQSSTTTFRIKKRFFFPQRYLLSQHYTNNELWVEKKEVQIFAAPFLFVGSLLEIIMFSSVFKFCLDLELRTILPIHYCHTSFKSSLSHLFNLVVVNRPHECSKSLQLTLRNISWEYL